MTEYSLLFISVLFSVRLRLRNRLAWGPIISVGYTYLDFKVEGRKS